MHGCYRRHRPRARSPPRHRSPGKRKVVAPRAERDEQEHGDLGQCGQRLDGLSCWRCRRNERLDAAIQPAILRPRPERSRATSPELAIPILASGCVLTDMLLRVPFPFQTVLLHDQLQRPSGRGPPASSVPTAPAPSAAAGRAPCREVQPAASGGLTTTASTGS